MTSNNSSHYYKKPRFSFKSRQLTEKNYKGESFCWLLLLYIICTTNLQCVHAKTRSIFRIPLITGTQWSWWQEEKGMGVFSFWKWNLAHTWHELTTWTLGALCERVRGWVKKFLTASHNQTDVKIGREESKHTLDNFVWVKLRKNTSHVTLNITQVKRRSFVTVVRNCKLH